MVIQADFTVKEQTPHIVLSAGNTTLDLNTIHTLPTLEEKFLGRFCDVRCCGCGTTTWTNKYKHQRMLQNTVTVQWNTNTKSHSTGRHNNVLRKKVILWYVTHDVTVYLHYFPGLENKS